VALLLTLFKVNDRQYIEVRPELRNETEDPVNHGQSFRRTTFIEAQNIL